MIDSNTKTASKSIGGITYTAQAMGQVTKETNYCLISESTKITNVLYVSSHTAVGRNVSIIYVGWQIARSNGESYGTGGEVNNKNNNGAIGEERVSIYTPIGKFAVFGAHTTYQNGSTIIAAYTTTYN